MTKARSASSSLIFAATIALLRTDAALSSSDIPQFPKNRYTPWNRLNWLVQNDARYLLFTPFTWNTFLTGPLERMSYEQVADYLGLNDAQYFSQWQNINNALQNIAIDSRTWDCWINHYIGNSWDELSNKHNVSWAFEELGWNSSTWKSTNPADWPETENKAFSQLTPAQVRAAERICCPAEIWDGFPLNEWDFNSGGFSTTQVNFEAKYSTSPPTESPTLNTPPPSVAPSASPSASPTTLSPTSQLSASPTTQPSGSPIATPSASPTGTPSSVPIDTPSMAPSFVPTSGPSASPTRAPSSAPISTPSVSPTAAPSENPSIRVVRVATSPPTNTPTLAPTSALSSTPTSSPTDSPTSVPSGGPTISPSDEPTTSPSGGPTVSPSDEPTVSPSSSPVALGCVANFTLVVETDKYPRETTWTLVETSSGKIVAESLGYLNDFEERRDTMCIQYNSCYLFTIHDAWDDGICCENGQGSYAGFIQYRDDSDDHIPIPGLNGGAFETMARHMFCLDDMGELVEGEGLGSAIGIRFNGRNGGL